MNDDSLRRALKDWSVPAPSTAARSRARHRALVALQNRGEHPGERFSFPVRKLAWGAIAAVVVCATALAVYFHPYARTENLASDRQLLGQIEQLFPHQLNAVVQKNGQTLLSVGQADEVGADQPVLLLFKRRDEVIRVLSYSGHRVCVPLGTEDTCFEVLEGADGGVILAGDRNVLLTSQHPVVGGYSVRAQRLSL